MKKKGDNLITQKERKKTGDGDKPLSKKTKKEDKKSVVELLKAGKDLYGFNWKKLIEKEYDPNDFDPYRFISKLPSKSPLKEGRTCIPKKKCKKKVTLVLDLDETLVHCSTDTGEKTAGISYQVCVKKRPYLDEFMEYASKHFEIIIFTASHEKYASALLDMLDEDKLVAHRVYRESCVIVDGNYIKDLDILDREPEKVVIIDNSPTAFGFQPENGIPIVSWYDSMADKELFNCISFLEKLKDADDVRPIIREKFKFYEIINAYKRQNAHLKRGGRNLFRRT